MKHYLFFLLFTLNFVVQGTVRVVPTSYSSIQLALFACNTGDTVSVLPGVYSERLYWPLRNGIKLIGTHGPDSTFIINNANGRVISMSVTVLDTSTQIKGFTISNNLNGVGSWNGGGIAVNGGDVKLVDLVVEHNSVTSGTQYGGGIVLQNSNSIIENCTIRNNSAVYGGGIYLYQGSLKIKNCTIDSNVVSHSNFATGGGVYFSSAIVDVDSSTFNYNSSSSSNINSGGGVVCWHSSVEIKHSTINYNTLSTATSNEGAGLSASWGNYLKLKQVEVVGNSAGDATSKSVGVALHLSRIQCLLSNVLIVGNYKGQGSLGEGLAIYYFYPDTSSSIFDHVTIAGNTSYYNNSILGKSIYIEEGNVKFQNSILHNSGISLSEIRLHTTKPASIDVNYSLVRGGYSGIGVINGNPSFRSSTDYRLSHNSICAASASPSSSLSVDIAGNLRPVPVNTRADMGCYEIDQSITNLNELKTEVTKAIYPNPIERGNELFIPLKNKLDIKIFDLNGKLMPFDILRKSNKLISISTQKFKRGIYFVNTSDEMVKLIVLE